MPFTDTYPGQSALVLSPRTPGAGVKDSHEKLDIGPAGQPDKLRQCSLVFLDDISTLNSFVSGPPIGGNIAGIATPGTWRLEKVTTGNVVMPFAEIFYHYVGLADDKPDAVRWSANAETQSGENILVDTTLYPRVQARILSVSVEIDTVIEGSQPSMSAVGDNDTPPSAPSVRPSDWDFLADPTFHYRNGWVLVDIQSQQLAGSSSLWLATYVYDYIYPYSP